MSARAKDALARLFGRKPQTAGRLDTIENGVLYGWAWSPRAPQRRIWVDIFADGAFAGQALANVWRADLAQAGIGEGGYGFQLDLKATPYAQAVHFAAFALPERTALASSLPSASKTESAKPEDLSPADYVRRTFAGWPALPLRKDALAAAQPNARPARLLAPANAPEGAQPAPSAYLAHIGQRQGVWGTFEPTLSRAEREGFLLWYLEGYGRMRGRLRAPLGPDDLDALNAPDDSGRAFLRRAFADRFAPWGAQSGEDADLEAEFQWRAFDSAVLALEDSLPDDASAARLRAAPPQEAPLSAFMRMWLRAHPILRQAPIETAQDRTNVWAWFLLFAAAAPHFLLYAPQEALRAFLQPQPCGQSAFAQACARLFPGADILGQDLARWRAEIAARGFDLHAGVFATQQPCGAPGKPPRYGRLGAGRARALEGPLVDVQVVGPFSRALGVGASCRRLADALARLDLSLRNCDFVQDHPNAVHDAGAYALQPLGPARVTILHLNLEDVPTALAYSPDAFSQTRLIGFPYLEATPISAAQRFGLSLLDEVFAASRYIEAAIAPHGLAAFVGAAVERPDPVGRARARAEAYGDLAGPDDFVFLTACDALSGAWRKNPLGAIRAFRRAFPDEGDVRLIVKTHSLARVSEAGERRMWEKAAAVCREDRRIALLEGFMDGQAYQNLAEGADCFVSLHRSEGLGYHLLEAMALGAPTIASDFSGSQDFCTPATSFLVGGRQIPIEFGQYPRVSAGQTWFEPDVTEAAGQMRRAWEDRRLRAATAQAGRKLVEEFYSPQAFAARLGAALGGALGRPVGLRDRPAN